MTTHIDPNLPGVDNSTPDAFVSSSVGAGGPRTPTPCPLGAGTPWLAIGEATATRPVTVKSDAALSIVCSVRPVGDGFDVNLYATRQGPQGVSLTITSVTGAGAVTAAGGSSITASFSSDTGGSYSQSDCTLSYTYEGQPLSVSPAIAAGRVWGHLSCPAAARSGDSSLCDGEADVLFEQCAQR
ncbi:MAG TPA: hypothetical protein VIF15_15430 [Polyangiaceae bacterium]